MSPQTQLLNRNLYRLNRALGAVYADDFSETLTIYHNRGTKLKQKEKDMAIQTIGAGTKIRTTTGCLPYFVSGMVAYATRDIAAGDDAGEFDFRQPENAGRLATLGVWNLSRSAYEVVAVPETRRMSPGDTVRMVLDMDDFAHTGEVGTVVSDDGDDALMVEFVQNGRKQSWLVHRFRVEFVKAAKPKWAYPCLAKSNLGNQLIVWLTGPGEGPEEAVGFVVAKGTSIHAVGADVKNWRLPTFEPMSEADLPRWAFPSYGRAKTSAKVVRFSEAGTGTVVVGSDDTTLGVSSTAFNMRNFIMLKNMKKPALKTPCYARGIANPKCVFFIKTQDCDTGQGVCVQNDATYGPRAGRVSDRIWLSDFVQDDTYDSSWSYPCFGIDINTELVVYFTGSAVGRVAVPGATGADVQAYSNKYRMQNFIMLRNPDIAKPKPTWPKFPCLGIRDDDKIVVHFTAKEHGTVLSTGHAYYYKKGYKSQSWNMLVFRPLDPGSPRLAECGVDAKEVRALFRGQSYPYHGEYSQTCHRLFLSHGCGINVEALARTCRNAFDDDLACVENDGSYTRVSRTTTITNVADREFPRIWRQRGVHGSSPLSGIVLRCDANHAYAVDADNDGTNIVTKLAGSWSDYDMESLPDGTSLTFAD